MGRAVSNGGDLIDASITNLLPPSSQLNLKIHD
jgi:hypothetical protein